MNKYFRTALLKIYDFNYFKTDFFLSFLSIPIQVVVIYLFWKNSFMSNSIADFNVYSMGKYYLYLNFIQVSYACAIKVTYEIFNEINTGNISIWILKPISYPYYIFIQKFSEFIIKIIISTTGLFIISLIFNFNIYAKDLLLAIVFSILGFIIIFEIHFLIGIITFWVKNVLSLRDNIMSLTYLFGGQLLPLSIMPNAIQKISSVLPIKYIYYAPCKVFSGVYSHTELLMILLNYSFWIITLIIILKITWKKGLLRINVQGG